MDSWLEKHSPKKIKDMVCNTTPIHNIVKWLDNFDNNKKKIKHKSKKKIKINTVISDNTTNENLASDTITKSNDIDDDEIPDTYIKSKTDNYKPTLLVSGNNGVGKTVAVNNILNELNYEIITITTFINSKNINEVINKLVYGKNIINMIQKIKKKQVIVIDELESLTSPADKKVILSLLKLNDVYYFFPIIFISNNKHNKLISEIKKKSNEIKFYDPSNMDMYKIANSIMVKENIRLDTDDIYDKILDYAQNDIRRLILILQDIYCIFGNEFTMENLTLYFNQTGKKDVDTELYTATKNLLYEFENFEECFKYYDTEKVILPLMILHNHNNIINRNKYLSEICKISELLSRGDIVENYIYSDQNWDIQHIHALYTCVYPSYIMNSIPEKLKNVKLGFTPDLNKTSIKNINKKNIVCINKYLKNINIIDIVYISKILKKLINNKKFDDCINLLKYYGIKSDGFESLLKIDKIDCDKIILSYKHKKKIMSSLLS